MAVELSEAKGSASAAVAELGFDAGRISKRRASVNKPDFREKVEGLTEEQKRIRQLEKVNVSRNTKNYLFMSAKFLKKIKHATVARALQWNCKQKVSGYRAHG
ncbi:hypothetical protein LZG73_07935 [Dyadobacter sp. CY326]|nr:hypothetical protein [Dyadobacter sp. CY326]